jgi:ABC-type antimicrobial peptide transport system permease subunit
MLSVELLKDFRGFTLDAEWEAEYGVVALFGPSGAGKTLTLQCLAGLMAPDGGRIVVNGRTIAVALVGVTQGYQQIRRLVVLRGRYFDAEDMASRSKVCLVTKELALKVFGVDNPIGRSLRMAELTFTVIGVFRERVTTYGLSEMQEDSVLIPLPLMKYYKGQEILNSLYAQASGPDQVKSLERQMYQLLKSRHPAEADYKVQTLTAILGAARTISFALSVVLVLIAFIAMLISGVGKYPDYNFYKIAGVDMGVKGTGEGANEEAPIDLKNLIH